MENNKFERSLEHHNICSFKLMHTAVFCTVSIATKNRKVETNQYVIHTQRKTWWKLPTNVPHYLFPCVVLFWVEILLNILISSITWFQIQLFDDTYFTALTLICIPSLVSSLFRPWPSPRSVSCSSNTKAPAFIIADAIDAKPLLRKSKPSMSSL